MALGAGLIGASRFVELVSTEAAKIFGLYPRKGVIQEGSDADIIILDPAVEHVISAATHHSRMDTNIYEGRKVKGKVCFTVSRTPPP
jgi:dihydropyrimidinase